MTEFTHARLVGLRAVAEEAEPMIVFGGPAQNTYVSVEKQELLALIAALEGLSTTNEHLVAYARKAEAALEAKTAEVEEARKYRTLPPGYVWQDYYSPDEVIKIRREAEFVIEATVRERDEARADRAEAALERVKKLHRPEPFYDEPSKQFCIVCQVSSGVWPCPTIQAIERTRTP